MIRKWSKDPTCYLVEPADLNQSPVDDLVKHNLQPLRMVVDWALDFLCQPHPDLGRTGVVCPGVKPSMNKNLFWLTVYEENPSVEDVYNVVMKYRNWFLELEPCEGFDAGYKTILMLFPKIANEDAPVLIDETQRKLKPEFVESGIMIGQFHPLCEQGGLHSQSFRPLRAPIPMLVIRQMVETDFPFLLHNASFVASYLKAFKGNIPSKLEKSVREAAQHFNLPFPEV